MGHALTGVGENCNLQAFCSRWEVRHDTITCLCSLAHAIDFGIPDLGTGATESPWVRQADQAAAQTETNIPPPIMQHATIHLVEIEQQADELSRIAQTIPPDIDSVNRGMLPKDIVQRLKQIEKLAKHLQRELTQ